MRRAALLLAALMLLPCLNRAQDASEPPRRWSFGTFGVAMRPDLVINQGGARDAAGNIVLKEGDRLLKWNDTALAGLDDFCRCLYASRPGEEVQVMFERPGADGKPVAQTAAIKLGNPRETLAELYRHRELRSRGFDWQRDSECFLRRDALRRKVWEQLDRHNLRKPWDHVSAAHERELDLWDCYESSSACSLLLKDPLAAHGFLTEATSPVAQSFRFGDAECWQLYTPAAKLLDRAPQPWTLPDLTPPLTGTKNDAAVVYQHPAEILLRALDTNAAARAAAGDPAALTAEIMALESLWRGEPGWEKTQALVNRLRPVHADHAAILARLDAVLPELRRLLTRFHEAAARHEQLPWASKEACGCVEGEAIGFQTPYGVCAVGGPGRNVWRTGEGTAVACILDLGGDDMYEDCAASRAGLPVSVVMDLGGNDHYRAGKWGVACGLFGTGLLFDEAGDDTYECGAWGLGAAFAGAGLLVDRAGNDRYLGGDFTLGCAAYGLGALVDLAGNDLLDSSMYSIGCGLPAGLGLVLDRAGDDRYRCGGRYGSGYGTAGEYTGWGIGCGFGFRTMAAGGTGLVVDVAGNDIYDAGEFGLGCGYFLGVGAVRDLAGDDIYHSSRYGLAAAAHCAVGLFRDDGGNDVYEGKTAASMAGVWDIATGYFYEGGGSDVYRCDGLGLGACAQNGFGIFWDAWGNDVYRTGGNCLGHGGGTEYGAGRLAKNFGVFFDGAGKDSYTGNKRKDSHTACDPEYGIFVDE
ncbi:MAG: hypothetical protein IT463_14925 [Planctomycetes bacterium]|nr:hypothetical protein [Planctomycetota bacterium]